MQSWSFVDGGKGLVSKETISSSDAISKSKNGLMGWDLKSAWSFGQQEATEHHGFGELSYQELMGKKLRDDSLRSEVEGGKMMNPYIVNTVTSTFSLEDESSSRLSSTVVESHSRDSSFIDLKLGRLGDPTETQNLRISKGGSVLSSSESSTPTKRVRIGVNSQNARCQVYGCNNDLSSSKDYHKRHKVCEVHSKTAQVIVNGIEQRFCQQCSRFHLLGEFDDGKRSCRKRLAGHNERRRKPQVGIHSAIHSYKSGFATSRDHGTGFTSFICQDVLASSQFHLDKYRTHNGYQHIKVEDGSDFSLLSSIPITSEHLHSKSLLSSNGSAKPILNLHDNEATSATGSIFSDRSNRYPCDLGGGNSGSHSVMQQGNSLGNEDFSAFDATSIVGGLSGITSSGCALSLLSSQSQNFSGIYVACPLIVSGGNNHYNMNQVSEKLVGVGPRASTSRVASKFTSSKTCSVDRNHLSSVLMSNGSNGIDYEMSDGTTVDLLQLSSELHRVEQQKQSMQVEQESDAFCWPRIT